MNNKHYFKQETNYTCGAAAMRMVLSTIGIKKSEKQVAKILKTNKVRGTWVKYFPILAEKYYLSYSVQRNSTIKILREYSKKGYKIIVCYSPTKRSDHFSVIQKIGLKYIYFYCPWYGTNTKYLIKDFKKMWHSHKKYEDEKKWFIAIK